MQIFGGIPLCDAASARESGHLGLAQVSRGVKPEARRNDESGANVTTNITVDSRIGSARRIHWLDRERVLLYPSLILLGAFLILFGVWTAWSLPRGIDPAGNPVGMDFIGFWSAARLAVEERPEAAYDENAITAMHRLAVPGLIEFDQPWLHPPTFLLVVFPLGLLPYLPAFGVFMAATLAIWATLIRRMFDDPRAWVVAVAFPAGLWNFSNGQTGFLTGGLAGFALLAVDRRPVLAGVLIGLLAIKPHLAVLFPLALIAGRRWETFATAAATALLFTLLSMAVFGWTTMHTFLGELIEIRAWLDLHQLNWLQMPSVYASALSFGLSAPAAMALQGIVASSAAGCVWLAWRVRAAPKEAKLATLSAASLLVSPYIFFYDLTWTGLAIAWLVKLGWRRGFRRGEREFLAGAWVCSSWLMIAKISGVQLGWTLPFALTLAGVRCALRPDDPGAMPVPSAAGGGAIEAT
jgi:hypothetical protein